VNQLCVLAQKLSMPHFINNSMEMEIKKGKKKAQQKFTIILLDWSKHIDNTSTQRKLNCTLHQTFRGQTIIEGNYALIPGPQSRVRILHTFKRRHKFKIASFKHTHRDRHRERLGLEVWGWVGRRHVSEAMATKWGGSLCLFYGD